jgi:hypothetical protein
MAAPDVCELDPGHHRRARHQARHRRGDLPRQRDAAVGGGAGRARTTRRCRGRVREPVDGVQGAQRRVRLPCDLLGRHRRCHCRTGQRRRHPHLPSRHPPRLPAAPRLGLSIRGAMGSPRGGAANALDAHRRRRRRGVVRGGKGGSRRAWDQPGRPSASAMSTETGSTHDWPSSGPDSSGARGRSWCGRIGSSRGGPSPQPSIRPSRSAPPSTMCSPERGNPNSSREDADDDA